MRVPSYNILLVATWVSDGPSVVQPYRVALDEVGDLVGEAELLTCHGDSAQRHRFIG